MNDSQKRKRLADRVAIVTGGASGIGKATVFELLDQGASVVLADLNLANGADVVACAKSLGMGGRVRFFPVDVSQEADLEHLVQFTCETFGKLDCLVNSAGTGGSVLPLIDNSLEDWERSIGLILRSVFLGIKYAARAMIECGSGGSIVTVASLAGHHGGAGGAAYSAAKAGAINLSRVAAVQLGEYRIRCNTVSPGAIITPLLHRGVNVEKFRHAAVQRQPWPDPGEPEDVARTICFLCSDESSFVTGTDILIDGGVSAAAGNLHGGESLLGNAIAESVEKTGFEAFDRGSTVRRDGQIESLEQRLERFQHISFLDSTHQPVKRTVLVTNIDDPLGKELVERLASSGHTVIGCSSEREHSALMQSSLGTPHRFDQLDYTHDSEVKNWVEMLSKCGVVPDLLINNVATAQSLNQIWRLDAADYDRALKQNVLGISNVLRHLLPVMMGTRRPATIVNFYSNPSHNSSEKSGLVSISEGALAGLTKTLSRELPPNMSAVLVNAGAIATTAQDKSPQSVSVEEWTRMVVPFLLALTRKDNGRTLSIPGLANL